MEDPTAGAWPLESYRNGSHISAAVQLINHGELVVIVVNLRNLFFVCLVFFYSLPYTHTTIFTDP